MDEGETIAREAGWLALPCGKDGKLKLDRKTLKIAAKAAAFGAAACLMLAGCSSKHKPMEIYTSGQEESQEAGKGTGTEKGLQKQTSQGQEPYGESGASATLADGGGRMEGRRIEKQSFDVTLRPLGRVTFASYEPDTSQNPLADVVFQIEKDGQTLSRLPGTSADNVGLELFGQVEAVSFTDYNGDDFDDIILIVSYYPGAGPQAAKPHSLIRYYKGSADGDFIYEQQMSDAASSALPEITIGTAKDFIGAKGTGAGRDAGDNGRGGTGKELESWQKAFTEYLDKDSDAAGQEGYALIAMTGDGIPQLVEVGRNAATGCRIIHYGKGKAQVTQLRRLNFDYIPGENLLCNAEGLMDSYCDMIYSIIDGQMCLVAAGFYGAEDNSRVQLDADGSPIYVYRWNDVEMSREEYERELSKVYDASKAVSYDYENLYSVDEVKKAIEEYGGR